MLKASNKKKVIVGMSGGVDSSVSAHLLIEAGYDVHGLFMKNWEEDDSTEHCTAAKDRQDAESVCQQLGIPLHTVNFAHEYWERVFSDCLDEFKAGRTPNPDILCNREIKFKEFLDHAIRLGADHIATGHYARSFIDEHGEYQLLRGIDSNKDQSYFLYAVNHAALEKTLFPIGEYQKPEIRAIAQQLGFITHDKKDSTGICFIGERHFKTFLESYLPKERGNMVTPEDEIVGQHDGLMYYTIGQRQGLGIGGQKNASDDPWFVYGKDLNSNTLYVVQGHDHPVLFSQHLSAVQLNLISKTPLKVGDKLSAKARYRQADQPCTISAIDENGFSLTFDSPQRAVTPGQSVVLYKDQQCLGGGIIDKVS